MVRRVTETPEWQRAKRVSVIPRPGVVTGPVAQRSEMSPSRHRGSSGQHRYRSAHSNEDASVVGDGRVGRAVDLEDVDRSRRRTAWADRARELALDGHDQTDLRRQTTSQGLHHQGPVGQSRDGDARSVVADQGTERRQHRCGVANVVNVMLRGGRMTGQLVPGIGIALQKRNNVTSAVGDLFKVSRGNSDEVVHWLRGDTRKTELVGELVVSGFGQVRSVGEHDRRNDAAASIELFEQGGRFGVSVEVNPFVSNTLLVQERLGTPTVRAPNGTDDGEGWGLNRHHSHFPRFCLSRLSSELVVTATRDRCRSTRDPRGRRRDLGPL